jgi:subtilisin family serine protease
LGAWLQSRSKRRERDSSSRLRLRCLEDRRLLSVSPLWWDQDWLDMSIGAGVAAEAAGATGSDSPPATVSLAGGEAVADHLIVQFAEDVDSATATQLVGALGGTLELPLAIIHGAVVEVDTFGDSLLAQADAWKASSQIVYAEPDYIVHTTRLPNDPQFSQLWGLNNTGQTGGTADADIDAPEAWDLTTGLSTIVVADIDTGGDYNHEDLAANMWVNPGEVPGDSIDNDGNGYVDDIHGIDAYNHDSDPMDDHGHGTHTAGTIGAVGDNNLGVTGVSWDVQIMPLKFLGSGGSGPTSAAVECVQYMTSMKTLHGVNVVASNNSWGGGGYDQSLYDAIQASNDAGIVFVAAAGNDGSNDDSIPFYPASYDLPGIIAVAATDSNDNLASFSNYGFTSVDLGAPGVNTLSTIPGNGYGYKSGTSMATPHVTGVVALAKSLWPSATVEEIKAAVLNGVDPVPSLAGRTVTGGRLNAFNTLQQLGLVVAGSSPAQGDVITAPVNDFVIDLSQAYDPSSVDPSDLTVNGVAADLVDQTDADTLTFHFSSSPVTSNGLQTMHIAEGAITRASDGDGLLDWTATFRYDVLPMQVDGTVPPDGSVVGLPLTSLQVQLNEAVDPASVGIDDLGLDQGTVSGATLVNPDLVEYTLSGIAVEGVLSISMAAGALTDGDGNPMLPYSGTLVLDYDTVPYPVPLEPVDPLGSLIYDPSVSGSISIAGDTDSFTIDLDDGQTISVVVDAEATLQPTIEVLDPGSVSIGTATAGAAGQDALLQTAATTGAGTYTVVVGGAGGSKSSSTRRWRRNRTTARETTISPRPRTSTAASARWGLERPSGGPCWGWPTGARPWDRTASDTRRFRWGLISRTSAAPGPRCSQARTTVTSS